MTSMKVGVAQIRPVWLDKAGTTRRIIETIGEAAAEDIELLVFPEAFLSGYPFWLCRTNGAAFEDGRQQRAYSQFLDAAVEIDAPEVRTIVEAARDHKVSIYLGTNERGRRRGRGTIYCTLLAVDRERGLLGAHRKLMPTYDERLCWGLGDARDLRVHQIGPFLMGGLNCWENWMPPARYALYSGGEEVHVSVWPGNASVSRDVTRMLALEGRVWSISACGLLSIADVPDDFEFKKDLVEQGAGTIFAGGSTIIAPNGDVCAAAAEGADGIISHVIDQDAVRRARQSLDLTGHYSRPDVFKMEVTRHRPDDDEI